MAYAGSRRSLSAEEIFSEMSVGTLFDEPSGMLSEI
jgi:hypothetical protein